ncbi:MAG: hypothetical protein JSV11_05415, partial [Nitrospiraceae bacterium]
MNLSEGTADHPADYHAVKFEYNDGSGWQAVTGPVDIPAGSSSIQVRTDTVDDSIDENNESFFLNVSVSGTSGTLAAASGTGVIIDDDITPPTISVSPGVDAAGGPVDEGDDAYFTVNVAKALENAQLNLGLRNGSADAGVDYNQTTFEYSIDGGSTWNTVSGPITLPAGSSSIIVKTDTIDDQIDEPNENFFLDASVSNPDGGSASASGAATIIDGTEPTIDSFLSSEGGIVIEGENAEFTVSITNAAENSQLTLSLADGTAVSPADYISSTFFYSVDGGPSQEYTGPITLSEGDHVVLVTTATVDDNVEEPDENFFLNASLSSPGGGVSASAIGNILDNDEPGVDIEEGVGVEGVTVTEGEDAVFHVTVSNAAAGATLDLNLTDGTADSPADYSSSSFTYNLGDGSGEQTYSGPVTLTDGGDYDITVTVTTVDDDLDEVSPEDFTLAAALSAIDGPDVTDSATGNILDNDEPGVDIEE